MQNPSTLPKLETTTINLSKYLGARDLYEYFYSMSQQFGDFVLVKGLIDMYIINDPELVKQVLKETNVNFDKRSPFYLRFRRMFGLGIVTSEGDNWRLQRDIMQPLFTTKGTKQYLDAMVAGVLATEERWANSLGNTVDLIQEMNDTALDIVANAFLSQDSFGDKKHDIEAWVAHINQYIGRLPLPLVSEPWFPRPSSIKGFIAKSRFRRFIRGVIKQRRQEEGKDDLLSVLVNASDKLSEDNLIDQVMTLIFGGHETSATAMVWTWYLLAMNPDADAKMCQELNEVLGGRLPTAEDLGRLSYTKAVIEESMRLFPPFWFENRTAMVDVELGDSIIPKGKMVVFSRYSLHRHEALWDEPNRFKPERFLSNGDQTKTRHRFSSVPFGGGPRICVGINFARMEILTVFAILAQKYKVEISESYKHELVSDLTLTPKGGLLARLVKRE